MRAGRKVAVDSSNAWERAQQAIARATERDGSVVTPDTAVSPFDASATMLIPRAEVFRRGSPQDPDITQRLPHGTHTPPRSAGGRHASPDAQDPNGHPGPQNGHGENGHGQNGHGQDGHPGPNGHRFRPLSPRPGHPQPGVPAEPPTTPVEVSDPALFRVVGHGAPPPGTSPFPAAEATPPGGLPETPAAPPRRSFWRRLFGRS